MKYNKEVIIIYIIRMTKQLTILTADDKLRRIRDEKYSFFMSLNINILIRIPPSFKILSLHKRLLHKKFEKKKKLNLKQN